MNLFNSPGLLLVATGSLLGLTFPLGKLGSQAGIHPVSWAFLFSCGAALGLLVFRVALRKPVLVNVGNMPFYFLAAVISLVLPNIITYRVIPELGSGYTGLLFTLSPLFTLALSSMWQVRMPGPLGLLGIAFGFVGAVIVSITRGEVGNPASIGWLLAGVSIPLLLACGNVYRTMAWPENAEPVELAIGMNLAAASMLFALLLMLPEATLPGGLETIKFTAVLTVLTAILMVAVHSRLQYVGGPTYLSQIGYIAAGVALLVGKLVFGENYSLITWTGALVILVGAVISVKAQKAT
jgi:drug/metabolite transporter (DMT)-like permease